MGNKFNLKIKISNNEKKNVPLHFRKQRRIEVFRLSIPL